MWHSHAATTQLLLVCGLEHSCPSILERQVEAAWLLLHFRSLPCCSFACMFWYSFCQLLCFLSIKAAQSIYSEGSDCAILPYTTSSPDPTGFFTNIVTVVKCHQLLYIRISSLMQGIIYLQLSSAWTPKLTAAMLGKRLPACVAIQKHMRAHTTFGAARYVAVALFRKDLLIQLIE